MCGALARRGAGSNPRRGAARVPVARAKVRAKVRRREKVRSEPVAERPITRGVVGVRRRVTRECAPRGCRSAHEQSPGARRVPSVKRRRRRRRQTRKIDVRAVRARVIGTIILLGTRRASFEGVHGAFELASFL